MFKVKYYVVREISLEALIKTVNKMLNEGGYEPQGGIAMTTNSQCNETSYAQALISKGSVI